jgi:hypothetical protein
MIDVLNDVDQVNDELEVLMAGDYVEGIRLEHDEESVNGMLDVLNDDE